MSVLFSTSSFLRTMLIALSVFLLAFFLRTNRLEERPLHSDEAVNHHLAEHVLRNGSYPYSHKNYHGPLYFHLLTAARTSMGDTISALRSVNVLIGLALIGILLSAAPILGGRGALIAAAFVSVSPTMIFHARYAIHEQLFLLASIGFAFSCYLYLVQERRSALFLAAGYLALLVATKETFVIAGAAIAVALLAAADQRLKPCFLALLRQKYAVLAALALCCLLIALLYTAGFQRNENLQELLYSLPQWFERSHSDRGHVKPFHYYLANVIVPTEPLLLMLSTLGVLFGGYLLSTQERRKRLFHPRTRHIRFFGAWALSALLIYSLIPYKTPWLVTNIVLPMLLFVAALLAQALPLLRRREHVTMFVSLLCLFTLLHGLGFNYRSLELPGASLQLHGFAGYGRDNPFCYAHTDETVFELVRHLEQILGKEPQAKVLIATDGYWPLPFYLRSIRSQVRYLKTTTPGRAARSFAAVITDSRRQKLGDEWSSRQFELRSGKVLAVNTRRKERQAVVVRGKLSRSGASRPHVRHF